MRQIKFRAWNSELKEIIPWYQMVDDHWSISDMSNCETLMQFTGLKDKNGIEIYEGDIISAVGYKPMLVTYNNRFASFCIKNDEWMFQHWFGEAIEGNETEVIGNIYENPELVTPK